jgi:hypothetical protein
MAEKKRYPIQLDAEIKAALDKHQKVSGSKSYKQAIANLLGLDTTQPKAKQSRGIYKEHTGPTPAVIDAAILRCWEYEHNNSFFDYEATRDRTRAEIITAVRKAMERTDSGGTTWMSLYPLWFKESLDEYVDDRLKSLKRRGFIDNATKGVWSMFSNVIASEEWDLLRVVTERIQPHKQLNIPDLLNRS